VDDEEQNGSMLEYSRGPPEKRVDRPKSPPRGLKWYLPTKGTKITKDPDLKIFTSRHLKTFVHFAPFVRNLLLICGRSPYPRAHFVTPGKNQLFGEDTAIPPSFGGESVFLRFMSDARH
jgi:hypothetical protein